MIDVSEFIDKLELAKKWMTLRIYRIDVIDMFKRTGNILIMSDQMDSYLSFEDYYEKHKNETQKN